MTSDAVLDNPEVVALLRAMLIKELPFGPEVTETVLNAVATVPYAGDDLAYLAEVQPVLSAVLTREVQPRIDAMRAEVEAAQAKTAALEAAFARAQREFEEFRRMATPTTIQ